jgi:O-antigen/teichoic acid export membrane protein
MIGTIKPKSEFGRNVLTLMTGTIVAQAIPIAISPILTRIYTPQDFGLLALFLALLSLFSVAINARYESAIMLPKKDEDAINIFALGIIINSTISLLLFIIVFLFNDSITHVLGNNAIAIWLYFIPLTLFFTGLFNILTAYNNRQKHYRDIADATIIKSMVMAVIQVGVGLIKSGASGLISGQILSQFFANMRLLKNIVNNRSLMQSINRLKIIALAKKYKNFPKFSLPSALANVLSGHLSNILISIFYSVSTLGFYSIVQRVLGIPSALMGQSIGQVFYEEGTQEKKRTGVAKNVFNTTLKRLILLGLPSFLILFVVVEELFAVVFGEEWRLAGQYAQIVIPMFFVRFVVATLSVTYDMFNHLKIELAWQMTLLVGTILIVVSSHFMNVEFKNLLILITLYTIGMQLISLFFLKQIASGEFFYDKQRKI